MNTKEKIDHLISISTLNARFVDSRIVTIGILFEDRRALIPPKQHYYTSQICFFLLYHGEVVNAHAQANAILQRSVSVYVSEWRR